MKLTELFDRGKFVITAEVGPPKGIHPEAVIEKARRTLSSLDGVNVTDNQSAVMRLGSLPMCALLKEAGLNPVFQLTCRDRNRIALQSDLLGAAALGIDNVLCLTGDHTTSGDHPGARPVFDLDSVSLLHAAKRLEEGLDLAGNALTGEGPSLARGAVVSPCADHSELQLLKMKRKAAAGAQFFQTQAVFEPQKFISFMERASDLERPVQLGILIPRSARMCRVMNERVAGVFVPEEIIRELEADEERARSGDGGIEICARIIRSCRPYCQGVHIMAMGFEERIPELLEKAGIA